MTWEIMEIEKSDRCWVWDYGELCCGKHEMWDWNIEWGSSWWNIE